MTNEIPVNENLFAINSGTSKDPRLHFLFFFFFRFLLAISKVVNAALYLIIRHLLIFNTWDINLLLIILPKGPLGYRF